MVETMLDWRFANSAGVRLSRPYCLFRSQSANPVKQITTSGDNHKGIIPLESLHCEDASNHTHVHAKQERTTACLESNDQLLLLRMYS